MAKQIPWSELEIHYTRSSGPGGQNVNKVNSKCVLRWSPRESAVLPEEVRERFLERHASRLTLAGDVVLMSDRYRDQKRNLEDCLEKLQSMLESVSTPPKSRKNTRPTRSSVRRKAQDKKALAQKKRNRRSNSWD